MTDLSLDIRAGLPETLRFLLEDYPREGWQADPGFHGLVSFWLDRHMMFRQLMARMTQDTEAFLDGGRDPRDFAQAVARYGGTFVNQLHGHHQIEDHHYFPVLRTHEPRIERGFDLLDADHHALDGILERFVGQANGAIQAAGTAPAENRGRPPAQGAGRSRTPDRPPPDRRGRPDRAGHPARWARRAGLSAARAVTNLTYRI
jgi:hypothetical protein